MLTSEHIQAAESVFARWYPKSFWSQGQYVYYWNNTFVYMKPGTAKGSKAIEDVDRVYVNHSGVNRNVPNWGDLSKEAHLYECMYSRGIDENTCMLALKHGHRIDQSSKSRGKWTPRGKYVWNDIEVLVDETDPDHWILVQMHSNNRWQDKGFIDLIPEICEKVKAISRLGSVDITVDVHDETLFMKRLLSDDVMNQAYKALESRQLYGKIHGFSDEENEKTDMMRKRFATRWGGSTVWTLTSMSDNELAFSRKGDGPKSGIPEDWHVTSRHIYNIVINVYHREDMIIPKEVVHILSEYGITRDTKGCTFDWEGPRAVDLFGRYYSKITLRPPGGNEWAISKKYCNMRF